MILFLDKKINNNTIGRRAKEREDFNMTEKIREYKMNGSLIIGVDAGYGNYKIARRVFLTAVSVSDKAPVFAKDYIELNGRYYIIGEGHKGFALPASNRFPA